MFWKFSQITQYIQVSCSQVPETSLPPSLTHLDVEVDFILYFFGKTAWRWGENTLPACTGLQQCSNATSWKCNFLKVPFRRCKVWKSISIFSVVQMARFRLYKQITTEFLWTKSSSHSGATSLYQCHREGPVNIARCFVNIQLDSNLYSEYVPLKDSILREKIYFTSRNISACSSKSDKISLRMLGPKEWSGYISPTLPKFCILCWEWFSVIGLLKKTWKHNSVHLDNECEAQLGQGRQNYDDIHPRSNQNKV